MDPCAGVLPYRSEGGAHRTFYGFQFVDWYRLIQEIESESKGCR